MYIFLFNLIWSRVAGPLDDLTWMGIYYPILVVTWFGTDDPLSIVTCSGFDDPWLNMAWSGVLQAVQVNIFNKLIQYSSGYAPVNVTPCPSPAGRGGYFWHFQKYLVRIPTWSRKFSVRIIKNPHMPLSDMG